MKISDRALKKCLCAKCGQYLSYPFVVIHQNNNYHEKCCDVSSDSDKVRFASEYEALARHFKFPCLNRSAGCPEYFPFEESTKQHINISCLYRPVLCPLNYTEMCPWKGSTLNLNLHFQKSHPNNRLKKPVFTIQVDITNTEYYVYVLDDVVILLQSKCDLETNSLWLNCINLPNALNMPSATCSIKLVPANSKEPSIEFETKTIAQTTDTFIDHNLFTPVELDTISHTCEEQSSKKKEEVPI